MEVLAPKNTEAVAEKVPQLSADIIEALLQRVRIVPVHGMRQHIGPKNEDDLEIQPPKISTIIERSGVSPTDLCDTLDERRHPAFRVQINQDIRDILGSSGLVYGNEGALFDKYRLVVRGDGSLWVNYQKIAGGRQIGHLNAEQVELLQNRCAFLVQERDAEHKMRVRADREKAAIANGKHPLLMRKP